MPANTKANFLQNCSRELMGNLTKITTYLHLPTPFDPNISHGKHAGVSFSPSKYIWVIKPF